MTTQLTQSYWPAEKSTGVREITLPGLLREAAADVPNHLALVDAVADPDARRHWTYAEFLAEVEQVSRALLARFSPGDRIGVWAPNSAEWVILQQAIAMSGMVVVAANPAYKAHELEYVLRHSGAVGLFYVSSYRGTDLEPVVQAALPTATSLKTLIKMEDWTDFLASGHPSTPLPEVKPTDPVQVQYTSGTTGFPKGAILHHMGIVNEAAFVGERAGMGPDGVCINAMPMYHIGGGAVTELQTIASHGTYVVMPGFNPGLTLELIEAYRGTHSLMVPTMLLAVLEHPDSATRDMSSVQTIMSGAAPVSEALVKKVTERWGCQFSILFGQTEMHGVTNQTRITDSPEDQAGTVGQPLPELEMKIADVVTGEVLPIGEQGEICARGYQNMLGYDQMPEQTAATIDEDGWLHMGDLGTMDERGFVKVTGRLKDMIIRGGVNIYPREIEEVLAGHPDFADLVVLGVPSEKWGEEVAAVVRLRQGAVQPDPLELKSWCRERISMHKSPSRWYFTEAYPQTPSGKIQKFLLRDQIADGDLKAVVLPSSSDQAKVSP
ncbi:fatty-acyl-CoA synthase [Citricoccus zhacaiensis]|uniref:Fatty-acyl-CoA synthase n=1 Tax=Citricoccus zhacaiensis TaxID=489142 RepID=A0ABQ2LWJ0_9MICC|nr:AMP-binding protein [Citricoccus zhacaiensis]GGO43692.1 fatty-acyl-CoA synthase [Citricoccus zhacaiensis]